MRARASPPPSASPRAAASGTMDRLPQTFEMPVDFRTCFSLQKKPTLCFFGFVNLMFSWLSAGLLWALDLVALEGLPLQQPPQQQVVPTIVKIKGFRFAHGSCHDVIKEDKIVLIT